LCFSSKIFIAKSEKNRIISKTRKGVLKLVYVNCTDHSIDIYDLSGKHLIKTIKPSGIEARVKYNYHQIEIDRDISVLAVTSRSVVDLPDPKKGTILIVSRLVRELLPERKDLASPGDPVKKNGRKIGCKGLLVNL
jgi:hypothetical protein